MPAVTIKFEMTKQDMRNGRKTGCPVSIALHVSPVRAFFFRSRATRTWVQRAVYYLFRVP